MTTIKTTVNTNFENYTDTLPNEDLFGKATRVNEVLSSGVLTGSEALGMITMNKVQPESKIKEKDGQIRDVIMLGSNSYLNLSTHPQVIDAVMEATRKYGYGMGSTSNYAGITELHKELEKRIADFYGTEDCIIFPSGYGTNVGVITALCGKNDVIINDSANHASIFDGCVLSKAELKIYPHSDMYALERILKRLPKEKSGRLIITDGVFSMDGDLAKLDAIVELAEKYKCRVMVDDAHGLGIVGLTGKGTAQYYQVMDKIDLHVGMLSKTPAGIGGYCASTKEIVQYLRLYARSYFFSTALPAPIVAGVNETFKLLETGNAGRKQLLENVNYLKMKLIKLGFDIKNSQSAIIPIMIYDEQILFKMHKKLRERGVYTNIVTYPAVRRKECRIRLCVMKDMTFAQLDKACEIISKIAKEFGIIK